MLLALQSAITSLLKSALPTLFDGAGAVQLAYGADSWRFDPLSADPVAGEPGPEDAVDALAFDPSAPAGPYLLTRPPYPGPKRVYLRSPDGDLIALSPAELNWDAANPAKFGFQPRPGRELTGFNQLEAHYGIVAAGSQLKLLHQASLTLTAPDAATAEQALSLALAVLALNREMLRQQAAFSHAAGSYQAVGTLKTLSFADGSAAGTAATLNLAAELDLKVQRLLGDGEGQPIAHIVSPGRAAGGRAVDIDPIVQN
jgi:hypothetical protein